MTAPSQPLPAARFQVQATDLAGNKSPPSVISWGVGATQSIACDAVGFGPVRVVPRSANACFADTMVDGVPAKVSSGQVALNGITLTPTGGTLIFVSERIGDGSVRTNCPVVVNFGPTMPVPLPSFNLSGLASQANAVNKSMAIAEGLLQVAGQRTVPGVQLELSADNGGQAKVTMRVTLPKAAFKTTSGGSGGDGVSVEFAPTFSNDLGVTVAGRIKLASVFLWRLKVKDLDLAYDHGTGVFDGSVGVVLAAATPAPGRAEPTLTFAIGIAPTAAACGLKKLTLVASNLNKPVGEGFFMQRLGGGFECVTSGFGATLKTAARLAAAGGVSFGPRIAVGSFEAEAISIDGTVTLNFPVTSPTPEALSIEATGKTKIVDLQLGEWTVKWTPPIQYELNGTLDLTVRGYGAKLGLRDRWISHKGFNFEFTGLVDLPGLEAGGSHAVVSSTGYAICIGPAGLRIGFGKIWKGGFTTFAANCDVAPFRSAVPATARAAATRSFGVAPDQRLLVIGAKGDGAPPKITLTGPKGATIADPRGPGGLKNDQALLVQDPDADTTFVVLYSPSPGTWQLETQPGSAQLKNVRLAEGPAPG